MKNIIIDRKPTSYIWASKALVGPDLKLTENLLITLQKGYIATIDSISLENLPQDLISGHNFYQLEEDITLLPGLIDAHVHLALDGKDFKQAIELWHDKERLFKRIEKTLEAYTSKGIVAIRDGGDSKGLNLECKEYFQKSPLPKPIIIATGQALRKEKAYGSFLGAGVTNLGEALEFIEAQIKAGADQLKILLSGIVSFKEYGKVGATQFSLQELKYIVAYAKEKGLKVMAHASSLAAVELAIEAKVTSIEHGYFLTEKALENMAKDNIYWVPTFVPVARQLHSPQYINWSTEERDIIKKTLEEHLLKLEKAHSLGVPLAIGSDSGASGVEHGKGLIEEIELYQKAGLSNLATLKAATLSNSMLLGLNDRYGSIAIKKEPHLIGVRGNPLDDIMIIKQIQWLFQPQDYQQPYQQSSL